MVALLLQRTRLLSKLLNKKSSVVTTKQFLTSKAEKGEAAVKKIAVHERPGITPADRKVVVVARKSRRNWWTVLNFEW